MRLDVAGDGHYDFRNHFVLLSELLSPLLPIDRRSATMNVPMSAGPVVVGLAVIGATLATWRRKLGEAGYYVVGSVVTGALVLRLSQPLWELVTPMAYFQFPWRFLGPLATLLVPLVAELGAKNLTEPMASIDPEVWQMVLDAEEAAKAAASQELTPSDEVLDLLKERNTARDKKDWGAADGLRDQIAELGWKIMDTPAGSELLPVDEYED